MSRADVGPRREETEGKGEASTWAGKCPLPGGILVGQGVGERGRSASCVTPIPRGMVTSLGLRCVLPTVGTEDHPI